MIRKDFPKLGEHYFEERLPNGLLVRVMEKPGFAKRYAFVAADYGSIDAEFFLNGKKYTTPQGVAHYLEHKMFDLPEGNAMQEFAKYAGANNAFTSYTMTAYYVECTEHLEENFEILLRMVTTGYFTDESVQKERGIIAQEIKKYEDSADSAVMENLFRIMYQNHPVRINIAGTVESIEEITADTLKLCHDAFYDPSNLIVCVIGDVDAAVAAFWEKNFRRVKTWYFQTHRDDDVVISASPEFLIRPACERLNIRYVLGSPVDKRTGRFFGKNCHGAEKVRRFREIWPDAQIDEFYSDSYSDSPLAELARKAWLVKGDQRLEWNK